MKIVFLNRYQNLVERGAETFVMELSSRLRKKFEVDILAGKEADSLKRILVGHYDIVIPINGGSQSLKASLGRILDNYKLVITGQSGVGRDTIWSIVVAKPDVFVSLTDYMANWAKKFAWGSKVVKIPNGVDLNKFTPNGSKINIDLPRPIILSVGALIWYKHHERVIEAVSHLKEGSLMVVGEGEDHLKLEELGRKKLPGRFKLISSNYNEMPKIYRSADLFTLPSWDREGFGLVYLEAMASGLAVVAPNDPTRSEVVGQGGILVDVKNTEKYCSSLEEALKTNWGDKPRKQAGRFSWDKITNQYGKLFKETVG